MSDFAGVQDVLRKYFDALYTCDVGLLAEVFHPRAIYATADETPPLYRDMPTYFEVVRGRTPPAASADPRRDTIDEIAFAGDNAAAARVRCTLGARDFVDLLTLVRENGRWRIIAKVFQIIEKE
ncbi:nuclear transport factor 2 family protein [Caulobacter sp. SL161]|uniref:nuclear transport factor 2 family protein n=1 Tax=Caulobacter sp. SL161 TaxID=2995156 RepID=UPI0022769DB1|nr:nuclear transport factor 2 family protein [Caulobacter sp. SL161]MCY1648878.1 nuclear transport factor 2 family protein [Caulobacter sp. SL161]